MVALDPDTTSFVGLVPDAPLRERVRLAPMLVLYTNKTSELGARSALRNIVPGAPYAHLGALVRLGEVTPAPFIIARDRFEGDEPPRRPEDVRYTVVTARTQLWDHGVDIDTRRIDVHLLLAPDTDADLAAAVKCYERAVEWAGGEGRDEFDGAFRLVTWFAPGFVPTMDHIGLFQSVVLLPPTRGAALLTREQRAEVLEALILDHLTSAVARDASVPRTMFPPLPFARPLIVFHRAISAGSLEKHTYAVGRCAARAVARLSRGIALGEDDDRSTDDQVAAFEQALEERRTAASDAAAAAADGSAPDLEALFAPALFRRLGPNDRASAAQAAREQFLGPDGTPGSRITHTRQALASAQHELQQDGPQVWAERLAATSGGISLAAQVLRTALDHLPNPRTRAEPTLGLDDAALEPLINGVVYVRPPWYAVLPWIAVFVGLTYLLADTLVSLEPTLPRYISGLTALLVALVIVLIEVRRARARTEHEERTLGRPARLVAAWAAAWRDWLVEQGVLREQRLLLSTVLDIVVQRAAELTELENGLIAEADRALARARGAGWNLTITPPDAWLPEVHDMIDRVSNEELDALWQDAAGDQGGVFLVGARSNRARVSQIARGWAESKASILSTPTLGASNSAEMYPRLFEGVEGTEWITTLTVARAMSSFARQAEVQGDTWIPRLYDDRASGWVVYSGPARAGG